MKSKALEKYLIFDDAKLGALKAQSFLLIIFCAVA